MLDKIVCGFKRDSLKVFYFTLLNFSWIQEEPWLIISEYRILYSFKCIDPVGTIVHYYPNFLTVTMNVLNSNREKWQDSSRHGKEAVY
jgi:hypothetical protein